MKRIDSKPELTIAHNALEKIGISLSDKNSPKQVMTFSNGYTRFLLGRHMSELLLNGKLHKAWQKTYYKLLNASKN